jgi:hypothetical protein
VLHLVVSLRASQTVWHVADLASLRHTETIKQLRNCSLPLPLTTGTEVTFTITASNTGPVRLRNLTMDIPAPATLQNCTPALAGPIPVHGSMVCYATYTFTQEWYEEGQLQLQASAQPHELSTPVTSGQATVTTTYLQQLQYHPGACTLPESRK